MNLNESQIKEKIEEITEKIKNSDDLMAKFKAEPIKTLEGLLGIDLPDEMIEKIVDGVKAKISLDKASDLLGGLGGLFKKK
ncbi:MAG: hypothetical protein E7654_05550 [Ruminococcaceae bacterium]|nr:hypothetical protein [Oscillospiraceae bacterium]